MTTKKKVLVGGLTVLTLLAAGLGYTAYRWQAKQKAAAAYQVFIARSFRDLQEQRLALAHEREYLALCRKQQDGRRAELQKKIMQMRELVQFLE
jgi:hypothetical protein